MRNCLVRSRARRWRPSTDARPFRGVIAQRPRRPPSGRRTTSSRHVRALPALPELDEDVEQHVEPGAAAASGDRLAVALANDRVAWRRAAPAGRRTPQPPRGRRAGSINARSAAASPAFSACSMRSYSAARSRSTAVGARAARARRARRPGQRPRARATRQRAPADIGPLRHAGAASGGDSVSYCPMRRAGRCGHLGALHPARGSQNRFDRTRHGEIVGEARLADVGGHRVDERAAHLGRRGAGPGRQHGVEPGLVERLARSCRCSASVMPSL